MPGGLTCAGRPDVAGSTYVALLRGINLGAKRRVAMADLRSLLSDIGYDDVRTHLQSGNAVFRAHTRSAAAVEKAVEKAITQRLAMDVRVVVRTPSQLVAVVDSNPLADIATDPARHMVVFLEEEPPAGWLEEIDAERFAPEQIALVGKEIYLWMPDGMHLSKLANAVITKKLGGAATARNWRTLTALVELSAPS